MADYHIDLGYDVNAVTSGGNAPLQWGVVAVNNGSGTAATMYAFQQGDTIEFVVYDISSLASTISGNTPSESTTPALGSPFISSAASDTVANPGSATRPVDDLIVLNGSQLNPNGSGGSTIFGDGPFPSWLLASGQSGMLSSTVVHLGVFALTLQLTVTGTAGTNSNYSQTFTATLPMAVGA